MSDKSLLEEFDRVVGVALKKFKPGYSYRIEYSPGNCNNMKIHIRAIVDQSVAVCMVWSRRKQYFRYQIKDLYALGVDYESRCIKSLGRSKFR